MLPTGQRPIQVTAATLAVLGLVSAGCAAPPSPQPSGEGAPRRRPRALEPRRRPPGTQPLNSIERPDAPDVDAAGEIAGPLVESLQAAGS